MNCWAWKSAQRSRPVAMFLSPGETKEGYGGAAVVPLAQGGLKGHVGRMTTLSYFSMPSTEGREKRIFHLKMDI